MTSEDGQSIEILDTSTGHSIASRVLNRQGQANAAGYEINFSGEPEFGDLFFLKVMPKELVMPGILMQLLDCRKESYQFKLWKFQRYIL